MSFQFELSVLFLVMMVEIFPSVKSRSVTGVNLNPYSNVARIQENPNDLAEIWNKLIFGQNEPRLEGDGKGVGKGYSGPSINEMVPRVTEVAQDRIYFQGFVLNNAANTARSKIISATDDFISKAANNNIEGNQYASDHAAHEIQQSFQYLANAGDKFVSGTSRTGCVLTVELAFGKGNPNAPCSSNIEIGADEGVSIGGGDGFLSAIGDVSTGLGLVNTGVGSAVGNIALNTGQVLSGGVSAADSFFTNGASIASSVVGNAGSGSSLSLGK